MRPMKRSRYPKLRDYDGFTIDPKEQTIRFACCDCALVHDMRVVITGKKKVQILFRRFNRGTAQLRRYAYGNLQQKPVNGWKMGRDNE